MTLCNYFLEGRCRYGDKCWNEHPRGGRGGSGHGDYNRGNQSNRGGGGFGNRVWVNPSQMSRGAGHSQPSSSSRGGVDWGGGNSEVGGGRNVSSSNMGFSQNRFSALNSQSNFSDGGDENEKHLEAIQKDMEVWQSSGQWPFSSYSLLKVPISGFVELSPEELRLEHYTSRASGDMESYMNSVQRLASQWRARVQELRTMNPSTRAAMTAELSNPKPSGFGSTVQSSQNFSFSLSNTGFGSGSTQPGPSGFESAGSFGSAPTASSFSFTSAAGKSSVPAGFSFTPATPSTPAAGFESCFGSSTPAGGSISGLPPGGGSSGFGGGMGASISGGVPELYTPQSELTEKELREFTAPRFTLGQIPLRPPPAELLTI